MKKLFLFVFALLSFSCFASQNVIVYVNLDNEIEYETEALFEKEKMYLPIKFIADILKIPYKQNHATLEIEINNYKISKTSIKKQDKNIQSDKILYLQNGITGLKNEFFLSENDIKTVLNKDITANESQLSIFIKTKESVNKEEKIKKSEFLSSSSIKPRALKDTIKPIAKRKLSVNTISFTNSTITNDYAQIYKTEKNHNSMFNNNLNVEVTGDYKKGKYKLNFGTNAYEDKLLNFSGLSVQYKNSNNKFDYILGKPEPIKLSNNQYSPDIIGMHIKGKVLKEENYKEIEGKVEKNSTVLVKINDEEEKELNTYGGNYSLKNLRYDCNNVDKITIKSKNPQGETKEILSKTFLHNENDENPKYEFIFGIGGLQNRLFAQDGYLYRNNSKKVVSGYKYHQKINDKLSQDFFFNFDKIIGNPDDTNIISIFNRSKYLNFMVFRNQNLMEGQSLLYSASYDLSKNDKMALYLGLSNSKVFDPSISSGLGFSANYDYSHIFKDNSNVKLSIFSASPSFRFAGGISDCDGYFWDKTGGKIQYFKTNDRLSFNVFFQKYLSNFNDYYLGGLVNINNYSVYLKLRNKKLPNIAFKFNQKDGSNNSGNLKSKMTEISFDKRIKNVYITGGLRENLYDNKYKADDFSGYYSKYSDIYTEVNFPFFKKFGNITLGHNIVEIKTDSRKDNYKSFKIGYTTPPFKSISLNAFVSNHYSGTKRGNDIGFGIVKRLKTGSTVSLNYRYSQMPYTIYDNIYLPTSIRHSFNLDFGELYGIGDGGLSALGLISQNKGYIIASAFLDINQNGIKDKDEPNLKDIPIKIEGMQNTVYTHKNGKTSLCPKNEGIYKVSLLEDELPTLLEIADKKYIDEYATVELGKSTKINFPLISNVGNITGTITIQDEFGVPLNFENKIICIFNEKGEEVDYTTPYDDNTFSFSGIKPGKYKITLAPEIIKLYNLQNINDKKDLDIIIPPEYKDYVNIDDINLKYTYTL